MKELEHHVGRAGYSQVGRSDLLTFPLHPLQLAGIVFTIALLALAWASRGRLNSWGSSSFIGTGLAPARTRRRWASARSAVLRSHCYSRPCTKARRSNGRMPG